MTTFGKLSVEVKVAIASGVVFFSMFISRTFLTENVDKVTRAKLFRFQFLLLVNCLMLLGSLYIWKKTVVTLCRASGPASYLTSCWKCTVLLFLAFAHLSYFTLLYLVSEEPYTFSLIAYTCLGSYVILLFFLFTFGCIEQGYSLLARRSGKTLTAAAGTSKCANKKVILAIGVTVALTCVGLLNAARPPALVHVEIPVHKLPASFNNLKLVLLADIHLGATVGKSKLAMIVRMVKDLQPDIVVIAGDLTDSPVASLGTATEPLRQLQPRMGTYFITGNHEYYTADVSNWFSHLRSLNIQSLHNSNARVSLSRDSDEWLCLAGVDDLEARLLRYSGHGMDLEKALAGCSPDRAIVLLAHQPLAAKKALQARPDISLILSGHTHGGQIFPLTIAAYLLNPFFSGLYKVGDRSFVYVTPGTMYYGIPMRIASRAEITEIILKSP
ncbi:transmembrane protein with metallophosphoesterase domain [Acipenser oxyrinchus oxyrinchus]|uniref:Transmembrane protein with metallophosphoesterase domain n=1 Tax=Acipenser oxyrinchus oxyrinchus TaxID=40147 RepID=A0AAD8G2Q7_ACIOX|nr:transmembrane protein with metallophosphoesterase domain [Acipenser oxyrinchus oxyrinchus]